MTQHYWFSALVILLRLWPNIEKTLYKQDWCWLLLIGSICDTAGAKRSYLLLIKVADMIVFVQSCDDLSLLYRVLLASVNRSCVWHQTTEIRYALFTYLSHSSRFTSIHLHLESSMHQSNHYYAKSLHSDIYMTDTYRPYPSNHDTLKQKCFKVGPASQTMVQH